MRRLIWFVIVVSVLLVGVSAPAAARRGGSGRAEPFWSPDGRWLVVVSYLGYANGLWLFDTADWNAPPRELVSFAPVDAQPNPTARSVYDVAFSPAGDYMATAEAGNGVRLWDTATFEMIDSFNASGSSVALSADGSLLAADHGGQMVRVFDAASGDLISEMINHNIWAMAFSAQGTLATGGCLLLDDGCQQGAAWLWDPQTGTLQDMVYSDTGWVTDLAFDPAGDELAVSSALDRVGTWYLSTAAWTELHPPSTSGDSRRVMADGVAYSPDGTLLAYGLSDGTIVLWDQAAEAARLTLHQPAYVAGITFSPDGAFFATGSVGGGVHIWETATGTVRAVLLSEE